MKHEDDFQVSLPYAGTSGWSGTDTSEQRAISDDANGITKSRQTLTMLYLFNQKVNGTTWKELANHLGWHHGTASGVLSVLHKEGRISRLLDKRNGCRVYVINDYVAGRATDMQGRKPKACPNCGHSL